MQRKHFNDLLAACHATHFKNHKKQYNVFNISYLLD